MKIKSIKAREILDSRGKPTVECRVELANGVTAKASVPSGGSTGSHEACELRDGDMKRYLGLGVQKAVRNVNDKIAPILIGANVTDQAVIDEKMLSLDGTEHKTKLGANAILAVSLAVARTGSVAEKLPLYEYLREVYSLGETKWKMPFPMMNLINGGRHATNSITVQEFMIVPKASTMAKRVRMGAEIFFALKKLLTEADGVTLVGDEGGYAPNLGSNEEALDFLTKAISVAGYKPRVDAFCAVDLAMSEFYDAKKKTYSLNDKTGKKRISPKELIETLEAWCENYPILSLEDALAEDDWESWAKLTSKLGRKVLLVGDDLFVTNLTRLKTGIESSVANSILIKPNQIGTLSETIDTIYFAKKNGYKTIISHRSGETSDSFIADLAVAVNADFIKTGSLSRGERVEKYNRLMEIEEELAIAKK